MTHNYNANIIEQFEKLIDQIKSDIDHSFTNEDKVKHGFRLKQIKNALTIIQKYNKKIKNGSELLHIEGIGKGTADRIDEILKTGKLAEIKLDNKYEKHLKSMNELEQIFGIGRASSYDLVINQNIDSIKKLKKEYQKGNLILPHQIVMGLKYHGVFKENIPRKEIDSINTFLQKIGSNINNKLIVTISGSYRRGKATSSDVDVLLSHPKVNYMHKFVTKLKEKKFIIDDLTDKDYTVKYMGFCKFHDNPIRRLDIKYVKFDSYYTALFHFTGSGHFNEQIRSLAKQLGYMLNEYGLYRIDGKEKIKIKINSERDIFDELGLEYIDPSKRD